MDYSKSNYWKLIGYTGPCGSDGFPIPGKLMSQYRRESNLTQDELARLLRVKRPTVTRMEVENHGLDSMKTRRDILRALPAIPAIALGLSSVSSDKVETLYDTSLLRQLLHYHRESYFSGGNTGTIREIDQTIETISSISNDIHHTDRAVLEVLCMYHQLGLDIAREKQTYRAASRFAENAYQIAATLKDDPLKASTLLRWSATLFEQGETTLAVAKIDEALRLKKLPDFLRGAVYIEAVRPYALVNTKTSLLHAKNALALSSAIPDEEKERHYVRLNLPFAQMRHAFVLNQIGSPENTLDILEEAEAELGNFPRRLIGIRILQSDAYLQQGEPEESARIALMALSTARQINSQPNIGLVQQIHTRLKIVAKRNEFVLTLGKHLESKTTLL